MNIIATLETLSMSSKEIAELTGKQHGHVIRDIKAMCQQIYDKNLDDPNMDHVDSKGIFVERDQRNYVSAIQLDKDHTLTLLTGYDANARLKVVRRWQELEENHSVPQAPVSLAQQALMTAQALVDIEQRLKRQEEQQELVSKATKGMFNQIKEVKQKAEELEQSVEAKIDHKINHSLDYDKNLNATEVGIYLRGVSAQEVNRCAAYLGWISPILKDENDARRGIIGWALQPEGQPYAAQRLDDTGRPLSPIFYSKTAAELIRQLRNSKPSSAWSQQQIIKRHRES